MRENMSRTLCPAAAEARPARAECVASGWSFTAGMRVIGRILAYLAVIAVLALIIVAGAFFVECASWGQCPSL
jgi:hypothetical protein